jgi:Abortive infection alpha
LSTVDRVGCLLKRNCVGPPRKKREDGPPAWKILRRWSGDDSQMDDAEIIAAASKGFAEGLTESGHNLVKRLFGPAFDTAGELLKEAVEITGLPIRTWLRHRRARFVSRTEEIIGDKPVNAVPPVILFSAFQNASLEGDDGLQDRWAALLANYATGTHTHRTFPEILKQLSREDADLLRECLYSVFCLPIESSPIWLKPLDMIIEPWSQKHEYQRRGMSLENLVRLGLIREEGVTINGQPIVHIFTRLGFNFATACEDPANLPRRE